MIERVEVFFHPGRKAEYARRMFPSMSRTYDRFLGLFTFSLDRRWRRKTVATARLTPGGRVLDLATGTGLLALDLAKAVAPGGHVIGLDITAAMLARGRERITQTPYRDIVELREADASQKLPFPDASFDSVTMGLALRYFEAETTVREMARVTRPGGRVVILDFAMPRRFWRPLYRFYVFGLIPFLSGLLSASRTVRELMTFFPRSIEQTYSREELVRIFSHAGLGDVSTTDLTFGVVRITAGTKV